MQLTLFTSDCPKCNILEQELRKHNLSYDKNYDASHLRGLGYTSYPILQVCEGNRVLYYTFVNALKYIRSKHEN